MTESRIILHTESSNGWGGQEMRIMTESLGMRQRGHTIYFAIQKGGKSVEPLRKEGFVVYEVDFKKWKWPYIFPLLCHIIKKHRIEIVNTHSSHDAWICGLAAKACRALVIRTRHLSTPIRVGLNSRLLYGILADYVVTTSSLVTQAVIVQARKDPSKVKTIATGVCLSRIDRAAAEREKWREALSLKEGVCLVGMMCVLRSWKGIEQFLQGVELLGNRSDLAFMLVGGGYLERYKQLCKEMGLEKRVYFTGHLEDPYPLLAAMDIVCLLSTANEGISQATIQAAALSKPLITTPVGGLAEVCIDGKTGIIVPPKDPEKFAQAIQTLQSSLELRTTLGAQGRKLVENNFTDQHMLNQMEGVYEMIWKRGRR